MGTLYLRTVCGLLATALCAFIGIPLIIQHNQTGWLLIAIAIVVFGITVAAAVMFLRSRNSGRKS
ncbi:MAG: hypothetical protein V4479_00135 [Actinomycetota bacterium]